MKNFLKKIICKHKNQITLTNIHGDLINALNARSIRICKDGNKLIFSNKLDKNCNEINNLFKVKEVYK